MSLGWNFVSEDVYQKSDSVAYLQDKKVTLVNGKSLERSGRKVLAEDTVICPTREQIFQALRLPIPDPLELRGELVPAQCLWFTQLGLMVFFRDNVIWSLDLDKSCSWSIDKPKCTVSRPSSESGCLTATVEFLPEVIVSEPADGLGYLQIDSVCPGMNLDSLERLGWRKDQHLQTDYLKQGARAYTCDSRVRDVTGNVLSTSSGKVILENGASVSSDRREVFEALNFTPVDYNAELAYEPANQLVFEELGLEIWAAHRILKVSLTEPKSWVPHNGVRRTLVEHDQNLRAKKYITLCF